MSQGAKTRQDLTYQPPPGHPSSPVQTDSLVIAFVSSTPSRVLFSMSALLCWKLSRYCRLPTSDYWLSSFDLASFFSLVNFRRGIWVDSKSPLLLQEFVHSPRNFKNFIAFRIYLYILLIRSFDLHFFILFKSLLLVISKEFQEFSYLKIIVPS